MTVTRVCQEPESRQPQVTKDKWPRASVGALKTLSFPKGSLAFSQIHLTLYL